MLTPQQTVAHVILDHSECAATFQRHRIDFCCKGHLTLEAACEQLGLNTKTLIQELSGVIAERSGPKASDPRELSTEGLIDHIVSKHHAYLRESLPFIQTMATKVARVHGGRNPLLLEINDVVFDLIEALIPHLDDEEKKLFPLLLADEVDLARAAPQLAAMHEEHLAVSVLLERMRSATQDFELPHWACNSYRILFAELEQLEADILVHVHLETHVLKPRFEIV
ncbi:MAG: DUF542 domain-containing protein [Bradymonadaceae bacterium]